MTKHSANTNNQIKTNEQSKKLNNINPKGQNNKKEKKSEPPSETYELKTIETIVMKAQ